MKMATNTADKDSARLLFISRCVCAGITSLYAVCVVIFVYWNEVGFPSVDDYVEDYTKRYLQDSSNPNHDPFNCTFPRADGKFIPNPKCTSIVSLVSVPFINAVMAAATNWVALKMTFYPIEYTGINLYRFKGQPLGLFGWQGIIPTKAAEMARKSVKMMTEKLFDVNEIFKRVDPKLAVEHMKPGFTKVMNEILEAQLNRQFPPDSRFASFVPTIKSQMLSWAEQEMPDFASGFMQDLVDNLDRVFDLEYMVVNEFTENKSLLNNVFITVGSNELTFIINSGYVFGFLFGVLFLPLWIFFPEWYVLPLIGGVVGYITNDIALRMMFKPLNPHYIKCCCCTYNFQGVFLKRQMEASAVFAELTVKQILHSRYMFHYMLNGPRRQAFREMLVSHTNTYVDKVLGRASTLVKAYLGDDEFAKMRKDIEDQTIANVEDIFGSLYEYTDKSLRLEEEIRTKMQALPPADFEGVLHPVFQEDELKLIVVGGALGMIVGFIQSTFP